MHRMGIWLTMWVVVSGVGGTGASGAQERSTGLDQLAARLDLTDRGIDKWLTRFVSDVDGDQAERLFVLRASGEPLAERAGDSSSVELDRELDRLLRQPGMDVVLVHNHPASRGLSAADVGQIAKQGVTAVVAIGRDGSVFVASAGRGMNRDLLQYRQYADALQEVKRRLRIEWPSGRVSVADSDAHINHLVSSALAEGGVIHYWWRLRGGSRASFERARAVFNEIIVGTAARLRSKGQPPEAKP